MTRASRRGAAGALGAAGVVLAALLACDDTIEPEPPKSANRPPETFLAISSDSLAAQLYQLPLAWLGSDTDGQVTAYRYRWVCLDLGGQACGPVPEWTATNATRATFTLYVPRPTARYRFEVVAVDDQGTADSTPAQQVFDLRNTLPVVSFAPQSTPTITFPAVTFYLQAVDADSSADPDDHDSGATVSLFRAWLDGDEANVHDVPASAGSVTFRPEDFGTGVGTNRTVYCQALDSGGAVSATIQHTWTVNAAPPDGILLVDDCRMGGGLEQRSDQSYRNAIDAMAPGRRVDLDIETIPRLGQADLEATLSLFRHVVWYTDADTVSSGALALARGALDALLRRGGHLVLATGLAFGTRGAFAADEARYLDLFGIVTVHPAPNGGTNFALSPEDTVHAAVTPGLTRLRYVNVGLGAIAECFESRQDAATRTLYTYPESTFVRATADTLHPFVNSVPFDIGIRHELEAGARAIYIGFPIGLPVNENMGENEGEIRELLRLAGIVSP